MTWDLANSLQAHPKHHAARLLVRSLNLLPASARSRAIAAFIVLTPGIDLARSHLNCPRAGLKIFIISYFFTLLFSFVLIVVFAAFDDVLLGTDPRRIYFFNDTSHLFLLTTIMPSYVALCMLVIYFSFKSRRQLKVWKLYADNNFHKFDQLRFPSACALIFLIASLLTINYVNEVLHNSVGKPLYWFLYLDSGGQITFNNLGIYYIIANFTTMAIIICASFCFIATMVDAMLFARSLSQTNDRALPSEDELKLSIESFQKACLCTKFLVVGLAINVIIWHGLHYASGYNIYAAMVAITISGLFLVSFPRLHIEMRWAELKNHSGKISDLKIDDLRPPYIRVLTRIADTLLFSLIVIVIWRQDSIIRIITKLLGYQ